MVQMVEHLPTKCKALSAIPNREREREREIKLYQAQDSYFHFNFSVEVLRSTR
jgi:hypothetical protein